MADRPTWGRKFTVAMTALGLSFLVVLALVHWGTAESVGPITLMWGGLVAVIVGAFSAANAYTSGTALRNNRPDPEP